MKTAKAAGLLIFFTASILYALADDCVKQNAWYTFTSIDSCPSIASGPRYDSPYACAAADSKRPVIENLAHAIVNGAVECDEAWKWNGGDACWEPSDECHKHADEIERAKRKASTLCDCIEPPRLDVLDVSFVKSICHNYNENGDGPLYHVADECDSGWSSELAASLVNRMYGKCQNWCVYSMADPTAKAWMWQPTGKCWRVDATTCLGFEKEKKDAVAAANSFCETKPCRRAHDHRVLSPDHVRLFCPQYLPEDSTPSLHEAKTCEPGKEARLGKSLANKAFQTCNSWCVFDLDTPAQLSWMWDAGNRCWREDEWCRQQQAEVNHVKKMAEGFCSPGARSRSADTSSDQRQKVVEAAAAAKAPPPQPPHQPPSAADAPSTPRKTKEADSSKEAATGSSQKAVEAQEAAAIAEPADKVSGVGVMLQEQEGGGIPGGEGGRVESRDGDVKAVGGAKQRREEVEKEKPRRESGDAKTAAGADVKADENARISTEAETAARREKHRMSGAQRRQTKERERVDTQHQESIESRFRTNRGGGGGGDGSGLGGADRVVRKKSVADESFKIVGTLLLIVGAVVLLVLFLPGEQKKRL